MLMLSRTFVCCLVLCTLVSQTQSATGITREFIMEAQAHDDKRSWPELVGKSFEEAKQVISAEAPDVERIIRVPVGSMVTRDYSPVRVRVYMENDKVAREPVRS